MCEHIIIEYAGEQEMPDGTTRSIYTCANPGCRSTIMPDPEEMTGREIINPKGKENGNASRI